jgi:cytidine deaminase
MDKQRIDWGVLSPSAWQCRENAHILGETKVGCAVLTETGRVFTGCNVEHIFRSHDFHAETNAIGNMVAGGEKKIKAILIVAQRKRFTPCGGCMDWIFQFGGPDCQVAFQSEQGGAYSIYTANELMPHYPM